MLRVKAIAGLAWLAVVPQLLTAQHFTQPGQLKSVDAPVTLDTTGMFLSHFARLGEDVYIAGQPTERGLRSLQQQGVTTVVNLRSPEEMKAIPFDEADVVAKLGMRYVYVPVRGNAQFPYSPAALDAFTEALKSTHGKVLLHCTVAWRASHLWAAYLIRERGLPVDSALANARAINLMDSMHSGAGRQPVEDFLNRSLPQLGHASKP